MLSVINAECQMQASFAECHYAECRYAECRSASKLAPLQNLRACIITLLPVNLVSVTQKHETRIKIKVSFLSSRF
jgi:hypothetical protein